MVVRQQPYNQELVDDLRRRFFEKYPSGHEDFDERDIPRVRKYDKYLYNILIVSQSDVAKSLERLERILKWRKEYEVNDITWDCFPDEIKELGPLYCRGRDKENCRILWFTVRHNKKGDAERQKLTKMLIAFWLEKLQWEDFDNPIVIVQDMTGAGVSNMDLDVIRFLIGCLEVYFPALCNMLYIYEMPWILNAIWKVIEKLLSEQSKAHLKFLKSKDVMEYFDADQLPEHMGGTDTYQWTYPPPEQFRDTQDDVDSDDGDSESEDVKMHSVLEFEASIQETEHKETNRGDANSVDTPGTSREPRKEEAQRVETLKATENIPTKTANDVAIKKVHFADEAIDGKENTEPSTSATRAKPKPILNDGKENNDPRVPTATIARPKKKVPVKKTKEVHNGPLLSTKPGASLIFKQSDKKNNPKEMKSSLSLSNTTDGRVAYKIKTTAPDKYRVRPSAGQINPGASVAVEVIFRGGESDKIVHDKFLIQSTEMGEELAKSTAQLTEFWKKVSRSTVVEHRLKCTCETPPEALVSNHDIMKELQTLNKKVARYDNEIAEGLSSSRSFLRLIVVMQMVIVCLLVYMIYTREAVVSLSSMSSCYSEPTDVKPEKL